MTRYTEASVVALTLAGAASYKAMEMVDASTTLGVIASIGAATTASILFTFAGIALTALSNRARRS